MQISRLLTATMQITPESQREKKVTTKSLLLYKNPLPTKHPTNPIQRVHPIICIHLIAIFPPALINPLVQMAHSVPITVAIVPFTTGVETKGVAGGGSR